MGVAHWSVNREGSHLSYVSRFSQRVPPKSRVGKKISSVDHWDTVEKEPSWQIRALNLRPRGWPWIQSGEC